MTSKVQIRGPAVEASRGEVRKENGNRNKKTTRRPTPTRTPRTPRYTEHLQCPGDHRDLNADTPCRGSTASKNTNTTSNTQRTQPTHSDSLRGLTRGSDSAATQRGPRSKQRSSAETAVLRRPSSPPGRVENPRSHRGGDSGNGRSHGGHRTLSVGKAGRPRIEGTDEGRRRQTAGGTNRRINTVEDRTRAHDSTSNIVASLQNRRIPLATHRRTTTGPNKYQTDR